MTTTDGKKLRRAWLSFLFSVFRFLIQSKFGSSHAYPFDIHLSWEKTLGGAALYMKTPVNFKNIQQEYQLCFDTMMLSMKDLTLPEVELFLEIGSIYARYPNFVKMLERSRKGEKISFWETDFIYFGDLDAGFINPENNKYLSILE